MSLNLDEVDLDGLTLEVGRRVRCRCPIVNVATLAHKQWLDRTTHELPGLGHWRFASGQGGMELLCEFSRESRLGGDPVANAREVFFACLDSLASRDGCEASTSGPLPAAEDIETELEATGIHWSRRESSWAMTLDFGIALTVEAVAGGALVCGDLAVWETLSDDAADALALFLNDAQSRIWGARFQWRGAAASATSYVTTQELERDLAASVQSVFDAVRRFGRSAQALLAPSLARHYRSFCQSSPLLVGAVSLFS